MNFHDYDEHPEHHGRPNKSALKRAAQDLEKFGADLVELPEEKLVKLPLNEKLTEAITQARNISSFGALKRQRKFIGKLLRELDDEIEPIRAAYEKLTTQTAQAIHRQHLIERWRDRMIGGDDSAINAFLEEHPDADRQKLRQLCRDARKEQENARPPRSARMLYQHLKELIDIPNEEGES